jgi:hypothetical protein
MNTVILFNASIYITAVALMIRNRRLSPDGTILADLEFSASARQIQIISPVTIPVRSFRKNI